MNPTLEQLWEGRADVGFQGPQGRQLKCIGSLLDSTTDTVKSLQLPPLTLPVDANTWAKHFHRHFQEQKGIADAYDTAKACELRFTAEELGAFTLRCERESTPLRWVLRRGRKGYELRLMNYSGATDPPQMTRRTFEQPHIQQSLPDAPVYTVPSAGGLYVAQTSGQRAAIIAPPVVDGLAQFGLSPTVDYAGAPTTALAAAWSDAELWTAAKPSGDYFGMARQTIVRIAIHRFTMRLLCGNEWSRTETSYVDGTKSLGYLQRAVWKVGYEAEVAERLRKNYAALGTSDMLARIREMAWVARFLEGPDAKIHDTVFDWLGEFVLRVVSDPAEVKQWAADRVDEGISYLLRFPTFVRAARFLVVVTDKELSIKGFSHELYASWRWR